MTAHRATKRNPKAEPWAPEKMLHVLNDGAWRGRRCFIVGGGPSAGKFDFSRLGGELTIGVNRAFERFEPTIVFSVDGRYYRALMMQNGTLLYDAQHGSKSRCREKSEALLAQFHALSSMKVWCQIEENEFPKPIRTVAWSGNKGLTKKMVEGVSTGENSGYAALNLAILLGADPIYLIGFDMHGGADGKQAWHHDAYPRAWVGDSSHQYENRFVPYFKKALPETAQRGFTVRNLYPMSGLDFMETATVEEALKPIRRPIVVSFGTPGYEKHIEGLKESLRWFEMDHDLQMVPSMGDWNENTCYKAAFIREMLDKYPYRDVLWMDADSRVRKYPAVFDNMDADVAVPYIDWKDFPKQTASSPNLLKVPVQLASGVCFFKNTRTVRALLSLWEEYNKDALAGKCYEQECLQRAVQVFKEQGQINVVALPVEYVHIADLMSEAEIEPVVSALQASRTMRNKVPPVEVRRRQALEKIRIPQNHAQRVLGGGA